MRNSINLSAWNNPVKVNGYALGISPFLCTDLKFFIELVFYARV